jgi:clan AA aspartic protease (TIGR02281 family)
LTALLIVALSALFCPVQAEMYKWVDDKGQVHFTDNLFNIPQEYLPKLKTYEERESNLSAGDIPLRKTEMGYLLDAKINGYVDIVLLMDTGASATVINPEVLVSAGVTLSENKPVLIRTANGDTHAGWAALDSLTVGAFQQNSMKIIAHDALQGADGLLGMDFLGAYRFEILTNASILRLAPQ